LNRKYFLYSLIVIAFIALLETLPTLPGLATGASPLNSGWNGTSIYASELEKLGYHVVPVTSWSRVSLENYTKALVIIVSPEQPYTQKDLDSIVNIINEAEHVSFIIADEGPFSNDVLKILGNRVAIDYERTIYGPNNNPYPLVRLETPEGEIYQLFLDYASPIIPVNPLGINVRGYIGGEYVAIYYRLNDKVEVYVVGDSSIFINRNMMLSPQLKYLDYALALAEDLAPNPKETIVLFESSKYPIKPLTPQELFYMGAATFNIRNILYAIAIYLHPIMWFPKIASKILSIENTILQKYVLSAGYFAALALAIALFLVKGRMGRIVGAKVHVSDAAEKPPEELDILVDTPIRRVVISGKIKLTSSDFEALYTALDTAFRKTVGKSFNDPDFPNILAKLTGLSIRDTEAYVREMVKLKRKIDRKSFFPIVLSWDRKVRKLLESSEVILEKIGTSLMKGKGIEYIIRKM